MWKELKPGFMMMLVMTVMVGVIYPVVMTAVSQVLFQDKAPRDAVAELMTRELKAEQWR